MHDIHSLRFASGATLADLLVASMLADCFPTAEQRSDSGFDQETSRISVTRDSLSA